jgi:hypothetical protein
MAILFDTSSSRLPIPESVQAEAWQANRGSTTPGTVLQRYLNQVCLDTLMPWIAEASSQSLCTVRGDRAGWDLVNGSAIQVGARRLVIVPSEAMDRDEFSVPQEWIDAPNWMGDYYLAVEVDPDEQWIEPWGYATHAMLATQSQYDPISRAYQLEGDRLISDLSILWVILRVSESTRAEVVDPPLLSARQAQAYIQQLASPSVSLPRWAMPAEQWCALINNDAWFQRLCTQRQESRRERTADARSSLDLGAWLQGALAAGWSTLDSLFPAEPNWATNLRSGSRATDLSQRYGRVIVLGESLPAVVLGIALQLDESDRRSISVQVFPNVEQIYLPDSLKLTMYATSGDEVQSVTADAQTRILQLRPFRCASGTTFRIRISTETTTVDELFIA